MRTVSIITAGAALVASAAPALAHVGVHGAEAGGPVAAGFLAGMAHPALGLDHVLAMVAVGLWAGIVGGRATWVWPASFVAAMIAAAVYGMVGPWYAHVETAVAGSIAALGLAVALRLPAPLVVGAVACGAFATAHGYAHGAELPPAAHAAAYIAGFALATAALHGIGVALGRTLSRGLPPLATRACGGLLAVAGVLMLVG